MPVSLFTPRLSLPLGTLACLAVLLACDGGLRGTPVDELPGRRAQLRLHAAQWHL